MPKSHTGPNGKAETADPPRRLENGEPGDIVLVAAEPDLAPEFRALGARVADSLRDDAALSSFVDRRKVAILVRRRVSLMAAYQLRDYLTRSMHPEQIRVLDLEASFGITGDFLPWWLIELESNNYEGLHQWMIEAWDRATAEPAPLVEPWPELVLRDTAPVPPFPVDVFPKALRGFCEAAAEVSGAPVDFSGVAMLAAASVAVGRSCQLFVKKDWSQGTCLYLAIVAEPGRAKSPAVRHPLSPLSRIDRDLRAKSKRDRLDWEDEKRNVKKGMPSPPEPPQRRKAVKDITKESLVAIMADNPRGVLSDPDELTAWLNGMNQYKGKGDDLQFWLSQWNGEPVSADRDGGKRSYYVHAPLCTVLGGIQPGVLGDLAAAAGKNDGFTDRILFTYPDKFPSREWEDDEIPEACRATWDDSIVRLDSQAMRFDPTESMEKPWPIAMHRDAYAGWKKWFDSNGAEMDDPDSPRWRVGVWAKMWIYCARFALILSRLRLSADGLGDSSLTQSPVMAGDLEGAIRLVDYFKSHAEKVHQSRTGGTGDTDSNEVLGWIRRKKVHQFRERDVRRDLRRRFPTPDDLHPALNVLTRAGAIRPAFEDRALSTPGPKPTPLFEVNPSVLATPHQKEL